MITGFVGRLSEQHDLLTEHRRLLDGVCDGDHGQPAFLHSSKTSRCSRFARRRIE